MTAPRNTPPRERARKRVFVGDLTSSNDAPRLLTSAAFGGQEPERESERIGRETRAATRASVGMGESEMTHRGRGAGNRPQAHGKTGEAGEPTSPPTARISACHNGVKGADSGTGEPTRKGLEKQQATGTSENAGERPTCASRIFHGQLVSRNPAPTSGNPSPSSTSAEARRNKPGEPATP